VRQENRYTFQQTPDWKVWGSKVTVFAVTARDPGNAAISAEAGRVAHFLLLSH
jgi:hypothetical protein